MSDFIVGLTGGVASGKSEITRRFAALGIAVADADLAARDAVAAGSTGLAEVVAAFGPDVLADDGELDRASMRRRVFADPDARTRLEAIVHPRVRAALQLACAAAPGPYVIAAIPLLAEGGGRDAYPWLDRILVIDVPQAVQHARLLARDGIEHALAERMIGAQRAFLSDTSHELRRPLTVLRTDLDVLSDPKLPIEERAVVEQEMRSAAESMSTLVTELLVLARSDEVNMKQQAVNLSEVCRAVVATARQTAPKHRFETNIASGIWVTGDEQALARAVGNIVQNAALYTDPGTRVEVDLSHADSEVRLRVTDDGPGMSEEDLAHAFERFYRGGNGRKSRPEGLGLGLAIVRQITEAHQGRIAIHSERGHGTTVAMGFPLRS